VEVHVRVEDQRVEHPQVEVHLQVEHQEVEVHSLKQV